MVLLSDDDIALLAIGAIKKEKSMLGEKLLSLLPVQSIKEEETQAKEDMSPLTRPIKVESPLLEEWLSLSPFFKEESSHSWGNSLCFPTPRLKKSYNELKFQHVCLRTACD